MTFLPSRILCLCGEDGSVGDTDCFIARAVELQDMPCLICSMFCALITCIKFRWAAIAQSV